jgi:sulfur-oxidizing protein SoxX
MGNIGPPLVAMKQRFPDKSKLRALIWDMTTRNPQTAMPPFGKHRILSDDEIDKITEYIYTL